MCGRFKLTSSAKFIAEHFKLSPFVDLNVSYNIAPSEDVPVVKQSDDKSRFVTYMRWGFIPAWQRETDISTKFINARAETVDEKPMFRQALLKRRCLIVADGFYEWSKGKIKQPYLVQLKTGAPFGMAGLW